MFITRATRHDESDRQQLFAMERWEPSDVKGVSFVARDGAVVGNVTVVEVEPQTLVVEDVVVAEGNRGSGIGRGLMQAAMNSRGGTLYLSCHPEFIAFYSHLGFTELPFDSLPARVQEFFVASGDAPSHLPEGHIHHFLKAR